jgi:cytochrome c
MFQPRYGYLGLIGAGLLLAYHIDSNRPAPEPEAAAATPETVAAVAQPAPAPAPVVQPAAPNAEAADKAAADKALAEQQAKAAADKAIAEQKARIAAEKAAVEQAAAEKAAAKAASDKAAAVAEAEKVAADKAAAAKAAAEQAAAKAAADKLTAAKAEAAQAPAPTPSAPAPAAPVAVAAAAAATGPWDGGDAAAGQVIFHKCQLCHYGEKGRTKIGPSLWGVVGRPSGTLEGYHYSTAMASYHHVWTPENLFVYLQSPMKVVHGTKMTFIGLPSETDRANVIAYLKTLK